MNFKKYSKLILGFVFSSTLLILPDCGPTQESETVLKTSTTPTKNTMPLKPKALVPKDKIPLIANSPQSEENRYNLQHLQSKPQEVLENKASTQIPKTTFKEYEFEGELRRTGSDIFPRLILKAPEGVFQFNEADSKKYSEWDGKKVRLSAEAKCLEIETEAVTGSLKCQVTRVDDFTPIE